MVELKTKITESGVLYVPNEIRECFGRHMRIIPGTRAVLMYPEGLDDEDILTSMEVIHKDVTNRIVLKEKQRGRIKT